MRACLRLCSAQMNARRYWILTQAVEFAPEVLTVGCILPCLLWPYLLFSPNVGHVPLSLLLRATVNRPGIAGIALVLGVLATVAVYATKGEKAGALSLIGLLFAAYTAVRYSYDSAMILPWLAFILCLAVTGEARLTIAAFLYIMLIANVTVGAVAYAMHYHQFPAEVVGVRASGLSGSPLLFSPLCLLTICGSAALVLSTSKLRMRVAALIVALIAVVMQVLTFTRAGWIAIVVALAAGMGNRRKPSRVWLLIAVLIVIVGAFMVRADGRISRIAHERSITGRIYIWALAGKAILRHPVTGLSSEEAKQLQQNTNVYLTLRGYTAIPGSAKSAYLDFAISYGVPFLILVILLFAALAQLSYSALARPSLPPGYQMINWWAIFSLFGLAAESLVEDTLFFHGNTLPVTTVLLSLLGLAAGISITPYERPAKAELIADD